MDNSTLIKVDKNQYELIENYKECFNEESFNARYIDIFDKYDYIVGDISAEKLRLKGFYEDSKKGSKDTKISYLKTYVEEYCAYGCGYFVLKKVNK